MNTNTQQKTKGFYIKKLIIQAVSIAIGVLIAMSPLGNSNVAAVPGMTVAIGICLAGLPSGWQIATKILGHALNFYTIAIKFVLSLLIGMVAFPVMLIKNIVGLILAIRNDKNMEVVDVQ